MPARSEADVLAAASEQRDEQRKLVAGDECRWENDEDGDDRPSGDSRGEARELERQQRRREESDAVPKGVGSRDGSAFEQARPAET